MTVSYFSHDSNARNSEKLIKVRMKYGASGYGVYFMILERLREEHDYMSIKNYNVIAFDLRVDASEIKSIVEDFGLFAFTDDGKCFYSEGFNKRMALKDAKSKKRAEAGKKGASNRWGKDKGGKNMAMLSNDNGNAIAKPFKIDGKKRKEKESKVKKTKQRPLRQKRAKRVYDQESDYYKLAEFFVEKIRENNANFKAPNLQTWSDDFRKLIEIDKRDKHQVALLIKWVQHDSFWAPNVLSPSKLRKKFDQLAMKMDQDGSMGPSEPPVSKKPVYSDGEQRSIDIMQAFSTHDHDAEKATRVLQAKYPDITLEAVERQVYPERFRKEDVF